MEASTLDLLLQETTSVQEAEVDHNIVFQIARWIKQNGILIFLSVGLVGNALTLITMTQSKMRQQPTSAYFAGLAVADSLALMSICLLESHLVEPYCHYYGAMSASSASCSVFIVLIVTAERALAVWFPLKTKSWMSQKKSRYLVVGAFAAAYAMYLPRFFLHSTTQYCRTAKGYNEFYYWQLITTYTFVPIFILVLLNAAIILRLNQRSKFLQDTTNTGKDNDTRKVTVVVLAISTTYILLNLPSVVFIMLHFQTSGHVFSDDNVNELVDNIIHMMLLVNHAANFWLYLLSSASFRSSLSLVFNVCLQRKPEMKPSTAPLTVSTEVKSCN